MCLYPGNQLTWAEWFRNIIICSQLQAPNLINIFLFSRYHKNWYILYFSDSLADCKSIHRWQHQIYNNNIIVFQQCPIQTFLPIIFNIDFKIIQLQVILFQLGNCLFIFNNQYFFHIYFLLVNFLTIFILILFQSKCN